MHPLRFIIVLGNSNPKTRAKRIDRAIECFQQSHTRYIDTELDVNHINTYIIMSGKWGGHRKEIEPESFLMKKYAIGQGIESEHILEESSSTNTIQNLLFSFKIIETFWPEIQNNKEIYICSSASHIPRAREICNRINSHSNVVGYLSTDEIVSRKSFEKEQHLISFLPTIINEFN